VCVCLYVCVVQLGAVSVELSELSAVECVYRFVSVYGFVSVSVVLVLWLFLAFFF